jgi:hypothetical protein
MAKDREREGERIIFFFATNTLLIRLQLEAAKNDWGRLILQWCVWLRYIHCMVTYISGRQA